MLSLGKTNVYEARAHRFVAGRAWVDRLHRASVQQVTWLATNPLAHHSAASIMLALGMPLHTVQKTIGHASLQMLSQRYGHIVPELAADEIAKLERALIGFTATG